MTAKRKRARLRLIAKIATKRLDWQPKKIVEVAK